MNLFSAFGRLSVMAGVAMALAVGLGGGDAASAQKRSSPPKKQLDPPKKPDPFAQEFKPIPSGPGIQICEPAAQAGTDAALADFGAGCGLWLQWTMGFHPELGQTPRWEQVYRAEKELHVPRVRISLAQSAGLYQVMGVTHVALGQISGTPERCVLSYQLYAMPGQKAAGNPIKVEGTEEQILAQLPQVARTLLTGLGVQKLKVPASVGATPAELTTTGHYPWYRDQQPTEADQKQIDALARKFPLAALLSFTRYGAANVQAQQETARHLLEQNSGNFLVVGIIATYIGSPTEEFARFVDSQVAAMNAPNNMALAYWAGTRANTPEEKLKAKVRIVRLAPHSSTAWNVLAYQYADSQEAIRLSRFFSAITPPEVEKLLPMYERWVYAATQATTLDPEYADAWRELAVATSFASTSERADAAFWKSYALDKSDMNLYMWGLEMYQTKWGGNPKALAKVARLATEAPFPENADFFRLGTELRGTGFGLEAKSMIARAIVQARSAVRRYPQNGDAHATLGYYLNDQQQVEEAETELKTAVQLNPNSDTGHFQLGKLYQASKRWPEAIAEYREDVRILTGSGSNPKGGFTARLALAEALTANPADPQYEEAEKLLNDLLKQEPNSYRPNADLGALLSRRGQYDAAIDLLRTAARLAPSNNFAPREIGKAYRLMSKFDEAVKAGEEAVAMSPKDYYALTELAETYAARGDNASSLKMRKRAVDAFPNFAQGHFNLGKLYLLMEKKDEARAELKRVLELNASAELRKSAQELLDKNP